MAVIEDRRKTMPEGSYTTSLFLGGIEKIVANLPLRLADPPKLGAFPSICSICFICGPVILSKENRPFTQPLHHASVKSPPEGPDLDDALSMAPATLPNPSMCAK